MSSEGEHREAAPPRRPLSREEREAMKRELKAQLRAYVDALKEQMLGRKDGARPDLEEAMARAEEEVARKMAQAKEAAAQRQKVSGAQAAYTGAASQAGKQGQAAQAPAQSSGGILAAIAAAAKKADGTEMMKEMTKETQQEAAPAAKADKAGNEVGRDVLSVASPAQKDQETEASAPAQAQAEASTGASEEDQRGEGEKRKEPAAASAIPKEELERLTRDIIAALKTVYDPEIPVDIYELGLVYRIDISDDRVVTIDMTLTAPGCPVAGDMPGWVQKAVSEVEGVKDVKVNLVFDPPWDMSRMSDEARLALNMF